MRYVFPSQSDRTFVVEALWAVGVYFSTLANESADAQLQEDYELKRAQSLRLAVDIERDK